MIYLDPACGDIETQRRMAEKACLDHEYTPILTVTERNHWWARHELARLLRVHDLYDVIVIPQIKVLGQEIHAILKMMARSRETGRRFIIPGVGDLSSVHGKFYANTSAAFIQYQLATSGREVERSGYVSADRLCREPHALSGVLRCEVCALDLEAIDNGERYVCLAGCLTVEANDVEQRVLEFTRQIDTDEPCRAWHCRVEDLSSRDRIESLVRQAASTDEQSEFDETYSEIKRLKRQAHHAETHPSFVWDWWDIPPLDDIDEDDRLRAARLHYADIIARQDGSLTYIGAGGEFEQRIRKLDTKPIPAPVMLESIDHGALTVHIGQALAIAQRPNPPVAPSGHVEDHAQPDQCRRQ